MASHCDMRLSSEVLRKPTASGHFLGQIGIVHPDLHVKRPQKLDQTAADMAAANQADALTGQVAVYITEVVV